MSNVMDHGRKILIAGFQTFASYGATSISTAHLIDSVLYEAKVKDPAIRCFVLWLIPLLIHIRNRSY